MPSVVVFDLETDLLFSQCAGTSRAQKLQIMEATVACALVIDADLCLDRERAHIALERGESLHFWSDDAGLAFEPLLRLFDTAECIVAYNGLDFDMPVLRKYYGSGRSSQDRYMSHRNKFHDPFVRVRSHADYWPKLNDLLLANGLHSKTASGVEAVTMWAEGRRDELLRYCSEDVRLLAQLCLKPCVIVPRAGEVPNHIFGITSAIASLRASTGMSAACEETETTELARKIPRR